MLSAPSTLSSRFSVPAQASRASSERSLVAEAGEPVRELRRELVVDGDPLRARRAAEERLVDPVETGELLDRPLVVVDAEIDEHVREAGVAAVALDDEQRGGLLAAAVAARGLRRREAVEQALRERPSGRAGERGRQRGDRLLGDEDVPLRREAGAGEAAGPVVAARAGEARAPPLAVDDPELALVAAVVRLRQARDGLLRGEPVAQQREPVGPVARVRVRLRRDRADVRLGPRHDRADGEELRLRRHPPLPRLEVAGADRVRRDGPSRRSAPSGRCRAAPGSARSRTPPPAARARA